MLRSRSWTFESASGSGRTLEEADEAYDAEITRLGDDRIVRTFGVWGYRWMRYVVDPVRRFWSWLRKVE